MPRAVPALLTLLTGDGQLTRAFAARGLGALKDQRAAAPLLAIADNASEPLAVRIQAVRGLALLGEARGGAGADAADHLAPGRTRTCSSRRSWRWASCATPAPSTC